jgi:ATP-dependent RNA helicase DHX29
MAGTKKKKKPASNPARGFATTSIASKPRAETTDSTIALDSAAQPKPWDKKQDDGATISIPDSSTPIVAPETISPEEFERQLQESELQMLVEKYSQKSKRDAVRQVTRLQTDRRLLRSQADFLNSRKWLPLELMDEILDVIANDYRHSGNSPDNSVSQKPLTEEELIIRLWTLQQTLDGAGFSAEKIDMVINYILGISEKVVIGNKDAIWGLEESLQWLARECSRDELPDYDNWQRKALQGLKSQTGIPFRLARLKHLQFGVNTDNVDLQTLLPKALLPLEPRHHGGLSPIQGWAKQKLRTHQPQLVPALRGRLSSQ